MLILQLVPYHFMHEKCRELSLVNALKENEGKKMLQDLGQASPKRRLHVSRLDF